MKKQVAEYIRSLGGEAYYSGKLKHMFVTAMNPRTIVNAVYKEFGAQNIPFTVRANEFINGKLNKVNLLFIH
jgi:hypothetical protein